MARRNPIARVGNYAAPVESTDIDEGMKQTLFGTKLDKTESDYVAQAKNKDTAKAAVQKARKANKQPPAQED